MKPLSDDVGKIINRIFSVHHPIMGELIMKWHKIVGATLGSKSLPIRILTNRSGGTKITILYIGIEYSSTAVEMHFQKDIIIERIAVYFGYKAINDIKFTTGVSL